MDVDTLLLLPERKLDAWRKYDREEPIGPRELRQQLAELLSMLANRWRREGASSVDRADFLLQTVQEQGQRSIDKMIRSLEAVATTKPSGYKRKRPRQQRHDRSSKASR